MRPCFVNRLLLSPPTTCSRRSFHHAFPRTRIPDPAIIENSLEKTLEIHRSANRQSLIRRVVNRSGTQTSPTRTPLDILTAHENEPTKSPSQQQIPSRKRGDRIIGAPKRPPRNTRGPNYWAVKWTPKHGRSEECPWLDNIEPDHIFPTGLSQLDAEIRAFGKYMAPTSREEQAIDQIMLDIVRILGKSVPHPLQMSGSRRTGLQMSHSNLNLMLPVTDPARPPDSIRKPSPNRWKNLLRFRKLLRAVYETLKQHPDYRVHLSNNLRENPTAVHQPTGLRLQFFYGEDLPASIEYIQDFLAEYPSLRPLYITTRLILETQGLFGPAKSSLDPLALQMLIAAFLKMNHGRFQRAGAAGTGYAEPLLAFLNTFGSDIDLTTTGVAIDPPGFFNTDSLKEASSTYDAEDVPAHIRGQRSLITAKKRAGIRGNEALAGRLCLQDPANYLRDLGGSCTRTVELQAAFADAYTRLKGAVDAWEPSQRDAPRTSILGRAVRANFEDFESRRAKIANNTVTRSIAGSTAL
ncbi:uncharacterized protein BJX67DRAFT_276021 [Aspergillus lucknowensis]|uniref:Uncharacterized protein n=1 Tax=Aspergillus lucknowensis TaxID=176173 RepID=A0ABR4LER1_9EURO